jgi:hypothetical protein
LLAITPFALRYGHDIEVLGRLPEELVFNFNRLVSMSRHVLSDAKHFSLIRTGDFYVSDSPEAPYVVTGFSGGVDSFCTLADYYYSCAIPSFGVTHLLFNNVGGNGLLAEPSQRLYQERLKNASKSAQKIGLDLISVDSNVHHFEHYPYINFHEFANASVGHLLSGRVGKYLYSSAYDYRRCLFESPRNIGYIDTSVLPFMSTCNMRIYPVGGEYTRLEKTQNIAKLDDAKALLNVCLHGAMNCSRCDKCVRTQLMLDLVGALEDFSACFDVKRFRSFRNYYFSEVIADPDDAFKQEILNYIHDNAIRLDGLVRLKGLLKRYLRGAIRNVSSRLAH